MIRLFTALLSCALLAAASSPPAPSKAAKTVAKPDGGVDAKAEVKKADAKPDGGVDAKVEVKKAEPKFTTKISKLGVKVDGPKLDLNENDGKFDVTGDGIAFNLGRPGEFAPKTLDEAKAAKADFNPERVTKEEKLEDGWNIQFQNRGAMGDNYFVWIRRTVGGKPLACETTVTSAEQAAKVEKLCLALQKL
jgi:hypothetical protein